MATSTETLGLIQPEAKDNYSISHFNENMETLDANAKANAEVHEDISESLDSMEEKIDTAHTKLDSIEQKINTTNSSLTNIDAKIGSSVIKSIQRVVKSFSDSEKEATISINTVNPAKTFVIFERLQHTGDTTADVSYTLAASSLTVSVAILVSHYTMKLGFWIVEFN